jgi:hypothetical protein
MPLPRHGLPVHRSPRLALVLAAAALGGCSDSASLAPAASSRHVSRTSFTGTWPFTVDAGVLGCTQPQSVTFTVAGRAYGLNASALDTGSAPADPIRAGDPKRPGRKKSLADVVAQGLTLCNR